MTGQDLNLIHTIDTGPLGDRARVARWIVDRTGMESGEDPIGFLLASYDLKIQEMNLIRERLTSLEGLLKAASVTCGDNSCNCPWAKKIKDPISTHRERFPDFDQPTDCARVGQR